MSSRDERPTKLSERRNKMKRTTAVSTALAVLMIGTLGYISPSLANAEDKNIEQMLTTAKTPADHKAIADFYQGEGAKFQRESEQHAGVAKKVAGEAGGQLPWASHHYEWAEHCRKLADSLGQAAREAQSLAKIHEGIAQSSAGQGGK
jgi:hypothetical protein